MDKTEFLLELTGKLSLLSWEEIADRWDYYSEMIDDRMEDGLTEEEAVAEMGSVDEIAALILSDIPLSKLVQKKIKSTKRLSVWVIVLLVLGSPIWISLLISAVAVVFSLYIVLWSVIISLWAAFVSLIAGALGGIAGGILLTFIQDRLVGVVLFSAGILCAGLSIFLFFGCKAATKGILLFTKKMALSTKRRLTGKENAV